MGEWGAMNDDTIEIVAAEVAKVNCNAIDDRMVAERILASLRAEGWEMYRPDDKADVVARLRAEFVTHLEAMPEIHEPVEIEEPT